MRKSNVLGHSSLIRNIRCKRARQVRLNTTKGEIPRMFIIAVGLASHRQPYTFIKNEFFRDPILWPWSHRFNRITTVTRRRRGTLCGHQGIGTIEPTRWLMELGIQPMHRDPGHPEQNGRHEKMHRKLKAEACTKPLA